MVYSGLEQRGNVVAIGPNGSFAVAKGSFSASDTARVITVRDSSGRITATAGSPGAGPGEIASGLVGLSLTDSSIVAVSNRPGRIIRYSRSGAFVGVVRVPRLNSVVILSIAADSVDLLSGAPAGAGALAVERMSLTSGAARIIVMPGDSGLTRLAARPGQPGRITVPAGAYVAGRLALGNVWTYHVQIRDADGDILYEIAPRPEPRMRSAGEMADVERKLRAPVAASRSTAAARSEADIHRLIANRAGEVLLYFQSSGLQLDTAGRVWVFRAEGAGSVAEVYTGTELSARIQIACPEVAGVEMNGEWILMLCAAQGDDALRSEVELQLYRIVVAPGGPRKLELP